MQNVTYASLGLDWTFSVPSTVKEFDDLAKKEGACLENAIDHEVFHGTLGEVRSKFADLLEEWTKTPECTTGAVGRESGRKDEDGDDILLNDAAYVNKVLASTGKSIKDFAFLQAKVLESVKFDPTTKERKPSQPKELPKKVKVAVAELLKLHGSELKGKKVDVLAICAKFEALNPTAPKMVLDPATNLPTAESLGRLIHANELRKAAEAKLVEVVAAELG